VLCIGRRLPEPAKLERTAKRRLCRNAGLHKFEPRVPDSTNLLVERPQRQRATQRFDAIDAAALVDEGGLTVIIERFAGAAIRFVPLSKRRA
jgi:hypothetical protein